MIKISLGCLALLFSGLLTASPIALYGLDGNALDSSGHGMDGSLQVTSHAMDRSSHQEGALSFSAHSKAIFPVIFTSSKEITISVWVWRQSADNSFFIINDGWMKGVILALEPMHAPAHQERVALLAGNGMEWFKAVTLAELPVRSWFHLIGTIDTKGKMVVYLDGKPLASGSMQTPLTFEPGNPTSMVFGSSQHAVLEAELGRVNDLAFYDKALTPTDVQKLYRSELAGTAHSFIFWMGAARVIGLALMGCGVSVYLTLWMRKQLSEHKEGVARQREKGLLKNLLSTPTEVRRP